MGTGARPSLDPFIGKVLGGTYQILRLVGKGGMGAVYEAQHTRLTKRFAIKILLSQEKPSREELARFHREASVLGRLGNRHIVEVFDFNYTPEGVPYVVMDLLHGQDLRSHLKQRGPMPLGLVVDLCGQIASGLTAAHRRGVIHRDLKPANIFLCAPEGGSGAGELLAKLLDFGLCREQHTSDQLTQHHQFLGTPHYMSPEQAACEPVDARSDVYALGTVLFEALTGQTAFPGSTRDEVFERVRRDPPPRASSHVRGVPAGVDAVLVKAMAKRPADRFGSARELWEALHGAYLQAPGTRRSQPRYQPSFGSEVETDDLATRPSTGLTLVPGGGSTLSVGPSLIPPGFDNASDLAPNTVIGSYRLLEQIGVGGMGTVWRAEHKTIGRSAAIKVLHPHCSAHPEILTRFFNEARAATSISDPGIVQIFDFGRHNDGRAFLAMELLEGEPLSKRLHRLGYVGLVESLILMRQVASSLGAAHARGIVHRDLKPENLFIVPDPAVIGGERVKILDFGVAKLVDDAGVNTTASTMLGTPMYMSPEQCRGAGEVDARSDVYAMGCNLFTLLTGRPPFKAAGSGDIIAMHLREPAPALSSRVSGIPREVDRLVQRCLAKSPGDRFANGAELAAALGELLELPSVLAARARTVRATSPPTTTPDTTLSSASSQVSFVPVPTRSWRASKRAIAIAAAAWGAAGVVGWWYVSGRDSSSASATTPPASLEAVSSSREPTVPADSATLTEPGPRELMTQQIRDGLAAFATWASTHPGAPCPRLADLGGPIVDPWGHPVQLTCTDQPADQIIGVRSFGPDGAPATDDDVASWQLGNEITSLVRGSRWVGTRPVKPKRVRPKPKPRPDNDGIPTTR